MFDRSSFQRNGDVALITCGGAGIGRAIALTFAGAGAAVMVSDLDEAAARAVVAEITNAGGRAVARSCNVTKEDDLATIVAQTVAAFGKLTLLVSNADGGGPKPFDSRWRNFGAPSI